MLTHSIAGWVASPWFTLGILASATLVLLALVLHLLRRDRRRNRRLAESEDRLALILDATDDIIHIKDCEGRYLYANRKAHEFFGLAPGDLHLHHNRELLADAQAVDVIERHEQQVLQSGRRIVMQKQVLQQSTGIEHTYLTVKMPLRDRAGQVNAICTLMTDVTSRVAAEARAHRLTFYDSLTDLPNAQFLSDRVTQAIGGAKRGEDNGALLLLGLDDFKKINDTQGFEHGDRVLQEVAQRLVTGTKARDTVSRISADIFAILLTQLGGHVDESAAKANTFLNRITHKINHSALPSDDPVTHRLRASVGVTLLTASTPSAEAALREADMAMHRAKAQGGNCAVFYEQHIQRELEEHLWLEQNLARAMTTSELQAYLQPQYSTSGHLTGAELLARWNHPERGPIAPDVFIPIAESTGLIKPLTEFILQEACRTLQAQARTGLRYPVSVNINPSCLMQPAFVTWLTQILAKSAVPASQLVLEITEGTWLEDSAQAARQMTDVRRLGVQFSVDDFGTGYSNLVTLQRLPISEIKIDKSLIQGIPGDADAAAIVRMALTLARQLGLRSVAEGVETAEQAQFLQTQHCDALQGYFLARPMPLEAWLRQPRTYAPAQAPAA